MQNTFKSILYGCLFIAHFGAVFGNANANSNTQQNLVFSSLEGAYPQIISEAVLKKAYAKIGVEFSVDWLPPKRSLMLADAGITDGELSRIEASIEYCSNLIMVKTPVNFIDGVVFSKSATVEVNGWKSLQPYLIGINKGTIFAEQGTKGMNIQFASSFKSLFKMLDKDRVDLIVAPKSIGLYQIAKHRLQGIVVNQPRLVRLNLYHFLHRRHAGLAIELEEVLKRMHDNGQIEAIRNQFIAELEQGLIH